MSLISGTKAEPDFTFCDVTPSPPGLILGT